MKVIPPLPSDLGQVAQWLILPIVLVAIANWVITTFFAKLAPQQQSVAKLGVFILIGLGAYGLSQLSPDVIAKIEPLWEILASVIAAYFAANVVKQVWTGLQLLGERLLLGGTEFRVVYKQRNGVLKHTVRGIPADIAA